MNANNFDTLSDQHLLFAEWHTHVANLLLVKGALDKLGAPPPPLPGALVACSERYIPLATSSIPWSDAPPAGEEVVVGDGDAEPRKPKPAKKPEAAKPEAAKTAKLPKKGSKLRAIYDAIDERPRTMRDIATRGSSSVPSEQVSPGLISMHKRGLISRHDRLDGSLYTRWSRPGGNDSQGEAAPPSPKGGKGGVKKGSPR